MATVMEQLREMHHKLGTLPNVLATSERTFPGLAPKAPPEGLTALTPTVGNLPTPITPDVPQPGSPLRTPFADSPNPVAPAAVSFTSPQPVAPDTGSLPFPSATAPGGSLSTPSGAGNSEMVTLLRQLVAAQRDGGIAGQQRPGRIPSSPVGVTWSASWSEDQDSYATASPSMDASNRAGIGGASSERGYGQNLRGNRYLQPDPEGQTPR